MAEEAKCSKLTFAGLWNVVSNTLPWSNHRIEILSITLSACGIIYQDVYRKTMMYIAITITAAYPAALQDLPPLGL